MSTHNNKESWEINRNSSQGRAEICLGGVDLPPTQMEKFGMVNYSARLHSYCTKKHNPDLFKPIAFYQFNFHWSQCGLK